MRSEKQGEGVLWLQKWPLHVEDVYLKDVIISADCCPTDLQYNADWTP